MLYDEVEPFGSPRDDARAGVVASVMANIYRNEKKRPEPYVPGDFFAREPAVVDKPLPTRDELALKMRVVFGAPGSGKRYVPKRPRS